MVAENRLIQRWTAAAVAGGEELRVSFPELMIYDSRGDRIEPKSFSYGGMSTDKGYVDTVTFSDVE